MNQNELDKLARQLAGPFAFVGVGVAQGSARYMSTAGPIGDEGSLFRVASISKIIVGLVLDRVMTAERIAHPYGVDVRGLLELPPDRFSSEITFGMLASHTAGLADVLVPTTDSIASFLMENSALCPSKPGTRFQYSNLGYVVLAAALEATSGRRFDHLATEVLHALEIVGGFNWSGVSAEVRQRALATYRRGPSGFVAQVDDAVPSKGLLMADGSLADLDHYLPAWNPAIFAPQGGLRTDLSGLLTLAQHVGRTAPHRPIWRQSDGPGAYLDGLMQDYGSGLQILPQPPFYPRPLVGHFANAYGFKGGVWYDAATDTAFAYALNGLAVGDESDALSEDERAIFAAIAAMEG